METKESIIEAVSIVSSDIWELTGCEYFNLSYMTDGFSEKVEFIGIVIWSSEMDDRETNEYGHPIETMEQHIKRRIIEEIEKMKSIVF